MISPNRVSPETAVSVAAPQAAGGPWLSLFAIGQPAWGILPWLLLLALPLAADPAPPATNASAPFLRFRDATLDYSGPSDDFTNLTEIRIGWFGPTNLADPLTGDLWWAANLAIREANEQSKTLVEHGAHAASPSKAAGASESQNPLSDSALPQSEGPAPSPPSDSSFVIRHSSFSTLPFRLIPCWAVNPWGTGVSQLARLVYEEQPLALLGSIDSATTHLAEQIVAKAQLPLLSPISTDKSVTLAGVSWMFSCAPSDDAIARVLVDEILAPERGDGAKLALLTATDHESRMTTREVLKEFSRRGRPPAYRFEVTPGARAIKEQLASLAKSHPRIVLIIAGVEDAARLVRAVRERLPSQGPEGCAVFGSHSMSRTRFCDLAGRAAEGVRFPQLFVADPAGAVPARFIDRFTRERQHPPDYAAALTYDATRLLLEAIRRAGPNRARIREALTQLSPWPGIAGQIHFDGTGQNQRTNLGMATIQSGTVVPLRR